MAEAHPRIALDSNVLIYLLETRSPLADAAASIVDAIEAGTLAGVMSAIASVEILTGPARAGDARGFESAAASLADLPLQLVPVDRAIAEDAAWIRGASGIGLEDAVHLATARRARATALVTNDHRLQSLPQLEVVYLDEFAA